MSRLQELEQEYRDLIGRDRKQDYESAQEALAYIQNSTAKYHGRCVRTLYIPKLFTEEDIRIFEKAVADLYGIFDKVIGAYYEDPGYRKLFGFDERLEKLILREKRYDSNVPIARIDIFYNEETQEFRYCEFNTDGTSAMNEDRELNEALKRTKAYQEFARRHEVRTFELFDTWVEEFLSIYDSWQDKKEAPSVAVVDFMENATEQEFHIFAQRFREKGVPAQVCEIRDLKYRDGVLFAPDGTAVNAVYRRAVTSDIMKHYEEVGDFIRAVEENAVCLIGEFRTQIVHNKILYKILHHPSTQAMLTEEEKEYVRRHVPYTADLTMDQIDYDGILKDKDRWIIKPEDSYGSQGVYAGVEYGPEEWKEKVDQCLSCSHYLLQEFCTPYETENVDLMQSADAPFQRYSNLTGMFVYNGKFCGIYSRISKTEIISTQYSEMALPTIVVKNL